MLNTTLTGIHVKLRALEPGDVDCCTPGKMTRLFGM